MEISRAAVPSVCIPVSDASQVGDARRQAALLAQRLGFSDTEQGKVALVATEAANNLVQHGGGGQIVLTRCECGAGLEMLALDKGPGMANVARCLRDGYSTAATPGTGLGAIKRQSLFFDIQSDVGTGTALLARFGCRPTVPAAAQAAPAGLCVAVDGETECGDTWTSSTRGAQTLVMLADGLGHGPQAALASQTAARIFEEHAAQSGPHALLEAIHAALHSTRGAAVAIAQVDHAKRQVVYAGIGNISGVLLAQDAALDSFANKTREPSGAARHLVSHNGTAGHHLYKLQEFVYPFDANALLILHSDGLLTQWRLDRYPGLARRDPALIAGVLYRDFQRGRDDAGVVVLPLRPGPPEA